MNDEINTMTDQPKGDKPWPVIIMVGMLATVIGLGLILRPTSEEGKLWWIDFLGTTNKGMLINPPVEVANGEILLNGENWPALANNTFKLVLIAQNGCSDACQEMLRITRQMHVRLNRDYDDLERGFMMVGVNATDAAAYVEELPDYDLLSLGSEELLDRLSNTNIATLGSEPTLIMINPIGVMMMAYTPENTGSELLEDVEHLLDLAR